MTRENDLPNSSFPIHHSAATAVYYWRGARPFPLDLEAHQTGWVIILLLHREGECGLLPVAWAQDCPPPDADPALPAASFHGDALDREALQLTLADLKNDGWVVSGRLDCHVTGRYTDPDFWPKINAHLWQQTKDEL